VSTLVGPFWKIRLEQKRDGIRIKVDVADAEVALDQETNMLLQLDGFLVDACQLNGAESSWVGKDGGDTRASWEFKDIKVVLQQLR
jgi:hypothetical protein